MDKLTHWTQHSTKDFIYSISSNFVAQIETKIEEQGISQNEIADKMKKSSGRISQVLNNPGNLSIRSMVELARALGMKVSIVAYDDHDPQNNRGPIDPDVFRKCWEYSDRPETLFEVDRVFASTSAFYPQACGSGLSGRDDIGGSAVMYLDSFAQKLGTYEIRPGVAA